MCRAEIVAEFSSDALSLRLGFRAFDIDVTLGNQLRNYQQAV
jgi:hypothetical protein